MRALRPLALLPVAVLGLTGCDDPRAAGDAHAIIVGTPEAVWEQVEDVIMEALQPPVLTVREERTFRVTHQDPMDEYWGRLRAFRQVLVIGSEDDFWVREALDDVRPRRTPDPPEILQATNVWARGQVVTIVVTEPGQEAQAVEDLAPQLHELLDDQFRAYAVNRMFISGRDTALADSLQQNVGFSLTLPNVYRHQSMDSVYRFRNDNPSPAELIREVAVTWRSPIPEEFDDEALTEWRQELVDDYYVDGQQLNLDLSDSRTVRVNGREGRQLQAIWESAPDAWPAGGPFITRAIPCPEQDRLYLMDAWLYAPGDDKYEYMIQLNTILDSFTCG